MSLAIAGVFLSMLAVCTVSDLRRRLIPNRVLVLALAVGLPLIVCFDPDSLPGRAASAFAAGGLFLTIALARSGAFGMGDVKLIAAMGAFLGPEVFTAVLIALCAGTMAGLFLVVRRGRVATKATIPLAPFLALGGLSVLLLPISPLQ